MTGPITVHLTAADGSTSTISVPQPAVQSTNTLVTPSTKYPVKNYSTLLLSGETIANTDVAVVLKRLTTPTSIILDKPGLYQWSDFGQYRSDSNAFGLGLFNPNCVALLGTTTKPSDTQLAMKPNTSTAGPSVPTVSGQTNNYTYIRVKQIGNLEVVGTNQGHLYNGVQLNGDDGLEPGLRLFGNLRISGIPGNSGNPPGETAAWSFLNAKGTSSAHLTGGGNVEVTGIRNSDGVLVGASPFEWNGSQFVDVYGVNCHDTLASMPTMYLTTDCTTTDFISTNCGSGQGSPGFNHERVDRITHTRFVFAQGTLNGLRNPTISVNSDQADSAITVVNPTYTGTFTWDKWSNTYAGNPNLVTGKNIKVTNASGAAIPITQVSQ